jgi:hypothetical protein
VGFSQVIQFRFTQVSQVQLGLVRLNGILGSARFRVVQLSPDRLSLVEFVTNRVQPDV